MNRFEEKNIPKIIHYCWFGGGEKNKLIKKCISSWKKYNPEYTIIEWNEKNVDLSCNRYVKEAYENKKWAFVADYIRLYVVYNKGGIYLDTDVELIKSLDEFLSYDAFFSIEKNGNINTGLGFGAKVGNKTVKRLMDSYEDIYFYDKKTGKLDLTPCTYRNTEDFKHIYGNIKDKINLKFRDNVIILGSEFFCPYNQKTGKINITSNTVGIHWYNASWRSKSINYREKFFRPIKRILGEKSFNYIKNFFIGRL